MTKFLAIIALYAIGALLGAWFLMLLVGVIHAEWIPQLPTISYPIALLISALRAASGFFGTSLGGVVAKTFQEKKS